MTSLTPGFQPYYPSFASITEQTQIQFDPLVQSLHNDDGLITGYHCQWRDILFEPNDLESINAILKVLTSNTTVSAIAIDSGVDSSFVQSTILTLYETGIVTFVSNNNNITAPAFYQHVVARMRAQRHKILQQNPILSLYEKDTISKQQLMGYLIEAYHFSAAAASHISLAITQAPSKDIETVLSRYLAEEYWHGTMLARGISKAGIAKDTLETISPTFPILGIINFLRHIARTDLQAYGLCIALTESPTSPAALLAKQDVWEAIKAMRLVPDETLDVFFEHDIIDHNAKHEEVPEIIFPEDEMISPKRQQELTKLAALYIAMIGNAYQTLKTIYATPDSPYWYERQ